jgi:serine/threonine protein phosphatase PrpC
MMSDLWYYTQADQTLGPVSAAQLRQLAAAGKLEATDLIWPEGKDRAQGVPAQAAIDFSTPAPPASSGAVQPDWLDDVRAAEAKPSPPPLPSPTRGEGETGAPAGLPAHTPQGEGRGGGAPDWLDDVRKAEEVEQEFLSIPWDAEPLDIEPEWVQAEQLDELAEVVEPTKPKATPAPAPKAPATPSIRLAIGSATTRGRVRDRNEDSLLVQQCTWSNRNQRHDIALIVVADGMGGHQAGDRASGLVIRVMCDVLTPLLTAALDDESPDPTDEILAETLDRGLQEANRVVRQAAQDNPSWKGMGSTAVALLVWDGKGYISLVGDCRVYHLHAGKLKQITRDQTLVARMVELGQLTPEEAARHPRRNEVAQAIGKYALLEPARYDISLSPGAWLVACCDGLYAHVDERTLQKEIVKAEVSARALADRLIDLANKGGGSDNCTVVVVHCSE